MDGPRTLGYGGQRGEDGGITGTKPEGQSGAEQATGGSRRSEIGGEGRGRRSDEPNWRRRQAHSIGSSPDRQRGRAQGFGGSLTRRHEFGGQVGRTRSDERNWRRRQEHPEIETEGVAESIIRGPQPNKLGATKRGIIGDGIGGYGIRGHQIRGLGMRGRNQARERGGQDQEIYQENSRTKLDNARMEQLKSGVDHEILITLTNVSNGFDKELDLDHSSPEDHDRMMNKLELIARCCSCEFAPSNIFQLLKMVNASGLVQHGHLNNFVIDVSKNENIPTEKYSEGIVNILALMETFFTRMPNSDFVHKSKLTILVLEGILNEQNKAVTAEIEISFQKIKSLHAQILDQMECSKKQSVANSEKEDRIQPPNNFRELSVVPSMQDINLHEENFLRANKLKGKYEDLDHYLDVQYRLLREDFIHPLRTGILDYLDIKSGRVPENTKQTDVTMYENVHLLGAVCTDQGLAYRLHFDTTRTRTWKWEHSKHLIYGSLVALSHDDFQTMHICTVVDRNVPDLLNGIVEVQVEHDAAEFDLFGPNVTFAMAETAAYYEPYRHVLGALKEITPANLPLQQYIVSCHRTIDAPNYLQQDNEVCFDFTPLIVNEKDPQYRDHIESLSGAAKFKNVPVLRLERWLSASQLKLDESQYSSLQHCLTKEFALVQGPPGTGKTFLGLKVVQLLLHNWTRWHPHRVYDEDEDEDEPILIVCYTNHALDQFLEGIIKSTDKKIVRVGSRSQSDLLKDCTLHSIRSDMKQQCTIPFSLYYMFQELKSEMSLLQEEISRTTCIIETMDYHIIRFDVLVDVMPLRHLHDFVSFYSGRDNPLIPWLLEGQCQFIQGDNSLDDHHVENSTDKKKYAQQEAIKDELHEIEESRRLDEYAKQNSKKKKSEARELMMKEVREQYFTLQNPLHGGEKADDSDWRKQKRDKIKQKKKRNVALRNMIQSQRYIQAMTEEESENIASITHLQGYDRVRLYKYWRELYKWKLIQGTEKQREQYQQLSQQLKEARYQLDKEIMKKAYVVGMTTTAAARYHLVLQEVQPKIIIVEEAAEVLEAHVVTALNRNCEHFILIGDHQQLRPNPTVYELAKDYNLDLSLFERMVNNDIPIKTLSLQHRMRPIISKLMKPFYKDLHDDESVQQYPEVKGIQHNLYFISHTDLEDHEKELQSKQNNFEAEYIRRLCNYLLLQNYAPSQITILTPYSGQLLQLKSIFGSSCKGVRITVVDNFQGEENDIIILSLVRSNKAGKLGFLKIENRVCVALSRAKIGLYVIGNFEFLANHSEIWLNIKAIAEEEGVISSALPLVCQQHPRTKINAALPKDFDEAPEGGCILPCDARLDCGHVCPLACHSYDAAHENVKCSKPCTKYLCEDHVCPKVCLEECGPCMVRVEKIIEECNHKDHIPCHEDPFFWTCQKPCEITLICGHRCTNVCGDNCTINCPAKVTRKLPCEHECEMKCHDDVTTFSCTNPCQTELQCGHPCTGTCGSCWQGRLHKRCTSICQRALICGHVCKELCSQACPPCKEKCLNQCSHSKCYKPCGAKCSPCKEPCLWSCQHYKCSKLCSEPCDRPKCNEPCPEMLQCGHPCIGLCGEPCPGLCRICHKKQVNEDCPSARFVVLDCFHIVEVESMDRWMEIENKTENEIGLRKCPKCSSTIRRTLRYKESIKTVLLDIEEIKKKTLGHFNPTEKIQRLKKLFEKVQSSSPRGFPERLLQSLGLSHSPLEYKYGSSREAIFAEALQTVPLSEGQYASLENLMTFALKLTQVHLKLFSYVALEKWLLEMTSYCYSMSLQQSEEFCEELEKLNLRSNLYRMKKQLRICCKESPNAEKLTQIDNASNRADKWLEILRNNKRFDDKLNQECEDDMKIINQVLHEANLGITENEKVQIVQAMLLKQGHWFKCPEGHIYVITECGGAMEESKCPECGAKIGGSHHRLVADNQLATEMDGATGPAWPSALM